MNSPARLLLLVTGMSAALLYSSCARQTSNKAESVNTNSQSGGRYQNQTDVLNTYSLQQLEEVIRNRGNKSVYQGEPAGLNNILSAAIIENVIQREKTIYGPDRRKDFFEIQNPDILQQTNSVAAIMDQQYLQQSPSGFQILSTCPTLGSKYHLCSKESYFEQPVPGVCTAFVVQPDVVATAGHCVPWLGSSARIVFGFEAQRVSDHVEVQRSISASDIYRPMRVLAQKNDPVGADFALVRVDRPMIGHVPLQLHLDGDINKGTLVYVLGYPSGLPLKLADNAIVNDVVPNGYFISNLDTFGGNSGSPVFNAATNSVEGILSRGGATDYKSEGTCNVALVCPLQPNRTKDCSGESATLMSQLADNLKALPSGTEKSVSSSVEVVKTFRSGEVLSGSGKASSGEYVVNSDPPPPGFKIGNFVYSLVGDRGCNAWSTCKASVEGNRVVFRFTLQGHDEWPPPGQAKSEGFLKVTYVPAQ